MSHPSTVVGTVHLEAPPARAARTAPAGSLRRLAAWLSALLADDGFSARFAAERQSDAGLVRRVERRHRP